MAKAADKTLNTTQSLSGLNFRFERKFIFHRSYLEDLVAMLYLNNFCFSEIYQRRQVNNVYYDDANHNFYKQNVSGVGKREKYRLRWYGDQFHDISRPTLEIKRKFGEVGDKISYKVPRFIYDLDRGNAFGLHQQLIEAIGWEDKICNKIMQLSPTLFNSYERRYFLSDCGKFRVTLDYNQRFYNPAISNYKDTERILDKRIVVLELKYNTEDDTTARSISQQFASRVSRNSKYVQGIDLINGQPLF